MSIDQNITPQATGRLTARQVRAKTYYLLARAVCARAFGVLLKFALIVYFLFCALVLGLRYVVLPNIDNYKPKVERLATEALGNKVSIAGIDASWSGLHPQLALEKVVIHDKSGNPALTLPQVSATLSWLSVFGELRLYRLEIARPDMDILRDAGGGLHVGGIFIDPAKTGSGAGLDWVLSQREIVIRDGRVRWNDHMRAAPELALEKVDFVLRNVWHHHRFALRATPPAALAAPLDVRAAFDHPHFTRRISDFRAWKGELYADLRDTDLAAWTSYVDYPVEVRQGKGSVRAWLQFDRAKVADFTADLRLADVSARLRPDLEPLNLVEVAGRVSVREELGAEGGNGVISFGENGHAVALSDFTMKTDDGLFLPRTTISESFVPAKNGRPAKTEIQAKLLDLETVATFVERLPLPAQQRQMLADFAPRGVLKDFSAQWQGVYPDISGYNVKGQFDNLALSPQAARPARPKTATDVAQAAMPAIPGFDNLSGRVEANDRGGSFSLASDRLTLQLPGYVEAPAMPFERFNMQASWIFQGADQLLFDVRKMEFAQEGMHASLTGKHLMPLRRAEGASPGTIDMSARIDRIELQRVGRYLPVQTPASLKHWLTGALVDGVAKDVRLKIKGDLAHFPFQAQGPADRARGEFSVSGKIEDGKLNYAPDEFAEGGKTPLWPVIDQINGNILFDRARMEITADSARTAGTVLSRVKAVIPDLAHHDMVLSVDGNAAGPLQNFVTFTRSSPVGGWIGHFTDETSASGNATLALKLQLPLERMKESKVQGSLQFTGNNVTLSAAIPSLQATSGKLDFNETGFSLAGIRSTFLGGPVTVSGGTQRDGSILVKAEGNLSADGLRKAYPTPAMQGTAQRITGGTRYTTAIRVRDKHPEILVESNLVGLALNFPEPLRKAANESLPLRFELNELQSADALVARDEIKISLGSAISARYERQKGAEKDAAWQVVRGGIGVNVPAPQPDSGLIANVNMNSLDIDAWRRATAPLIAHGKAPGDTQQQPDALGIAQYIEPEVLAARATELVVMDRKLDNVVVGASHQKGAWQANIDSEQASGYVTWTEPRFGRGLGRVTARLATLVIPKSAESKVGELLEEDDSPTTQMPAIDIIAENFELFGKKFGHLELAAQNARGASGREWRINKLAIANADAELKATGRWTRKDGENLSNLNYTLQIADAGKLLDRFGFANVLRGGRGKMEGEIHWKGLPFSLDVPSLNGNLQLNLASGQFLKVDPAAAKLLGVLSLQSLPRRLVLDFRDVFSEGFAFDGVTASVSIADGVAKTDNFKMRGVAATVLLSGTADIAKEAQNLHVVVIPEINVGAASVVYGLAVNPVIGVGTFLAQLFLREPLAKAFTFEYQVTGPWKEPVVTKLSNKPPSPTGKAPVNPASNG